MEIVNPTNIVLVCSLSCNSVSLVCNLSLALLKFQLAVALLATNYSDSISGVIKIQIKIIVIIKVSLFLKRYEQAEVSCNQFLLKSHIPFI